MTAQNHVAKVMALARDPRSAQWASADRGGAVYLWNGAVNQRPRLLRQGRIAEDLAFGPRGTLFIATRLEDQQGKPATLEVWDTASGQLLDETTTASTESNFACAVSPDQNWVATCAGDDDALYVFPLNDAGGRPLAKPLSRGNRLPLHGRGARLGKVAFAADGSYRVGFGRALRRDFNDYGAVERAFDLGSPRLLGEPPKDAGWRAPADPYGGWEVRFRDPETRLSLELYFRKRPLCTIKLDPQTQGSVRSFCWLADRERTFALAVGTDKQSGVFVYRLSSRGECPLIRYFRDHTGWVTSLSVSADGKFLASASVDSSVKIWSLEGIRTWPETQLSNRDFPQGAAWGASFIHQGDQVLATRLLEAGIAYHRGLREGDVISEVTFIRGGQRVTETSSQGVLNALARTPIVQTLVLGTKRDGRPRPPILLVPAWEPLMTLFVARGGEWSLSTPQGPYDASVQGDNLFGWQVNRGADVTPKFHDAKSFREKLERPEIIRRLLSAGSLSTATRLAGLPAAGDPGQALAKLSAALPTVKVGSPPDGQAFVTGAPVTLLAEVNFPDADAMQRFRVRAFVNGAPLPAPELTSTGLRQTAQWRLAPADPFNAATVVVEETGRQLGEFDLQSVHFRAQVPAAKPRLHILALAAGNYHLAKHKLQFPVADATSMVKRLQAGAEGLYEIGTVIALYDDQLSQQSAADAVKRLRRELAAAHGADLLVVFLAGHGVAFGEEYYFVPPDKSLQAFDERQVRAIGISWELLLRLASVPCRKLFLIDTCHAGNVLLKDDPPRHWKAAIRPLSREQALVVSATDIDQPAVEFPSLRHGVFTLCLLQGLEGRADTANDGEVNYSELSKYAVDRVTKITRSGEYLQTPTVSPLQLEWMSLYVPLSRYRPPPPRDSKP